VTPTRLAHRITTDLEVSGKLEGDVIVASGTLLILTGMVNGSLIIEADGEAQIEGLVTGNVENHGDLAVRGTILGSLIDVEGGNSNVAPYASVGNADTEPGEGLDL
jgi:cytoskeletal protein CcmA (bactofilin family)